MAVSQEDASAPFKKHVLREAQGSREVNAQHDSQALQKQQLPLSPLHP